MGILVDEDDVTTSDEAGAGRPTGVEETELGGYGGGGGTFMGVEPTGGVAAVGGVEAFAKAVGTNLQVLECVTMESAGKN